MRSSLVACVPLAVLYGVGTVAAQEDDREYVQLVNEYFLTNSVYPQERGEIQLTASPRIDFEDGHRAAFPFAIEFGLTDRWQIEAEWVSLAVNRTNGLPGRSGIGDLELETQYSFMNLGGSSTHVAVGLGLTIPAGPPEAGGSEGEWELEPSISVGRDFRVAGRPSQLFSQVALGFVGAGEERGSAADAEPEARELFVGLGYVVATGDARWAAELSWATNQWNGGDESELYFSPGLVLDLPDTWEFGVGAPIGILGEARAFRLSLFLLYEFELGDGD
ncbi:MAG: hypothetical protein OEO79_12925 [Gemmatimonadota bacterium]|nr:hypothetical protein [Gemmatimonadota bacterium]